MVEFSHFSPGEALAAFLARTESVSTDSVELTRVGSLVGRVLAEPVHLDRDSPPCDVSAMDGYAFCFESLQKGSLPIVGECRIGKPPAKLPDGTALRIYTGSPVPEGADTVLRLEHAHESKETVCPAVDVSVSIGQEIRRQGENAPKGSEVLSAESPLTPAAMSALAAIAPPLVKVFRPLRVAILTTGNELESPENDEVMPAAWRLRNSNGPALQAMISSLAWVGEVTCKHAPDSLDPLARELSTLIADADVVVLTGGVSQGAYDLVPEAIERSGGETLFHGVTARPGRPTLGAIAGTVPLLALPGNPLAVLSAGRRLLVPLLRRRAGLAIADPPMPSLVLTSWSGKRLPLTWWRPVRFVDSGLAELVSLRGSGDTCGPAKSDGFVEVPPDSVSTGPYSFYSWSP